MIDFFNSFSTEIVFLHVISAIVWVGGMIVLRFGVHYSMANVDDPSIKLGRTLESLKRFFFMVIPSIIILLITAIIMILALGFKGTPTYSIVIIKEIIWVVMVIVFIMIFVKRNKAQSSFDKGDFKNAKSILSPIATWMIPMNILLGLIALYLGIMLRGL